MLWNPEVEDEAILLAADSLTRHLVKDKDTNVDPSGLVDDDTMSTPASDAPTASVIIAVMALIVHFLGY